MSEQEAVQSSPMDILNAMDSEPAQVSSEPAQAESQPEAFDLNKWGQAKVKYTASGKEVEEPLETIIKTRAPYGYHAAQRLEEANKRFLAAEEQIKKAQELESKWKQFDDYARQNPQWMDHVNKMWSERAQFEANLDPNDPLARQFSAFKSEIDGMKGSMSQLLEHFKKQEQAKQDQVYMSQLEDIKKAYPNINFDAADEQGRSLEYQILEHASKKGITSFDTAFKDYYHEKLIAIERAKAKEEAARELQEQRKKGILGKAQAPQKTYAPSDVRRMSEDDIREAALNDASIWS